MLCYCCGKTTMISLLKKKGGGSCHTNTYIHVYIALFSFQFIGKQAKFENIWIITTYHCVRLERHCLFIHFLTCEWGDGWWRGKGVLIRLRLLIFTNFTTEFFKYFIWNMNRVRLYCYVVNFELPWVGGGGGGQCFILKQHDTVVIFVFTAAHYKLKIYITLIYPGQN